MRTLPGLTLAVVLAACGGDAPQRATMSPTDLAGGWAIHAFREGSDMSYVSYTMTATAEPDGWTVTFPDRAPMPVVMRAGAADSFVVELGPYPSVVRPNVQVRAVTTGILVGDRLEGRFDAYYEAAGADSVVRGRFEGTRAP